MIPAEMFEEVKTMLENRNAAIAEKLSNFMKGMDSVVQTMQEDGPSPRKKALKRLHQKSGMSTTLWKILGQMPYDAQLPEASTPQMMQDELRQACLYSKARYMRLYPERF